MITDETKPTIEDWLQIIGFLILMGLIIALPNACLVMEAQAAEDRAESVMVISESCVIEE